MDEGGAEGGASGTEGGIQPLDSQPTMSTTIKRLFCPVVLFSQIWGLTSVALALLWMRKYNGFGWSDNNVFNYHPVALTTGMIYLYGQAILIYRLFRFKPKRILKICHAVLHTAIFSLTTFGLVAVFEFHNRSRIPNLYSLHSWIGLVLVICFGLQYLMGILVYLLPYASMRLRVLSMPYHRSFGVVMFGIAGATAVMGITEKAIFSEIKCWKERSCETADIINWMGLSVILYVLSVIFLVTVPEYRRVPLPSD